MSVDLKDVVVRYIRHPNTGKTIGCAVAVKTPEGIKTGWSQCNPLDNFSRKAARAIAIQRALFPPKEPLQQASVKFKLYRAGESAFVEPYVQTITVTHPLEHILESVEGIAKRAFGPKEVDPATKFEALANQLELPATEEPIEFLRDADGGILGIVKNGVFEPMGQTEADMDRTDAMADAMGDFGGGLEDENCFGPGDMGLAEASGRMDGQAGPEYRDPPREF